VKRPTVRRKGAGPVARRRLMTVFGALTTLGGALVLLLAFALLAYFGPGPGAQQGGSTDVVLRAGAGVPEIAATLRTAGVIGSDVFFVVAAKLTGAGRSLKAGEYDVPSHASLSDILTAIREGRVVRRFVTVPEGATSQMVMDILMKADFLAGVAPAPPEGAVLPETYEVQRGDDRAAILERMMEARDRLLASLWIHRRADLPYRTPDEAVILASIVEKETAKPDERPRIAAVFLNRLKAGMPLGADPTVIYGLTAGKPLGHGLTRSELESDTPYNTYKVAGLPPTPIANPGRASLAAALDPPQTNEFYFVADGTGGHVFASTKDAHDLNVKKWRALEATHNCAAVASNRATSC
jgi:UPF0755 protein